MVALLARALVTAQGAEVVRVKPLPAIDDAGVSCTILAFVSQPGQNYYQAPDTYAVVTYGPDTPMTVKAVQLLKVIPTVDLVWMGRVGVSDEP